MTDLYLYDQNFDKSDHSRPSDEQITSTALYKISKPVPIKDWSSLVKAIMAHTSIDTLVLSFHGYDGGMIVGDDAKDLGETAVKNLFSGGARKLPRINKIVFLGCNVGMRPTQMSAFGALFGAKEVSGYTWSVVKQRVTIKIPRGTDEEKIRATFEPFSQYAVGMLTPAGFLSAKVKHKDDTERFVVMYGSSDGDLATKIPIPFGEQKNRKPWKKATPIRLKASEARKAEDDYQTNPTVGFEWVTVTP